MMGCPELSQSFKEGQIGNCATVLLKWTKIKNSHLISAFVFTTQFVKPATSGCTARFVSDLIGNHGVRVSFVDATCKYHSIFHRIDA